jgi:hypothetical protein
MTTFLLGIALFQAAAQQGGATPFSFGTAPFTVECAESHNSQRFVRIGRSPPFGQDSPQRTQRYRIDPSARTVTANFGYRSESEPWVENPRTFRDARFTPGGRIVFCMRDDGGRCLVPVSRSERVPSGHERSVTGQAGQTILHLGRNTITSWSHFLVGASDGSYFLSNTWVEGTCRRL